MQINKTRVKIAVFATALLGMGTIASASGMAYIKEAFSDVSTTWIQLLTTIPTVSQLVTTLCIGLLITRWSKKKLILTGILCWIIGGLTPFFVHVFPVMIVMRLLFGVGLGLTIPLATSIIAEVFEGQERANMLGFQNSFLMLGGMLYTYGGGWLSQIGWQYCFLAYAIGIPVFFIVLINLPDMGVSKGESESILDKFKLPWEVYLVSLFGLIFTTFWFGFSTNISMFISNAGLGGSVESGTVSALKNLAGFLTGLVFGWFSKRIRYYTMSLAPLWAAVGFFLLSRSESFGMVCVSSFILGAGVSLFQPTVSLVVSNIAPRDLVTNAVSISTAVSNLGTFRSPIIVNAISSMAGADTQPVPERIKFMVVVVAYIILGVGFAAYITFRFERKRAKAKEKE